MLIEDALQQLVVMPLQSRLIESCLKACRDEQQDLSRRQNLLRGSSQASFGIPARSRSKTDWAVAIELLEYFAEVIGLGSGLESGLDFWTVSWRST